jgi:succinate dehydrogenase flavin-adding protein (antitoxin of CptAB toxin-antitoxin module)
MMNEFAYNHMTPELNAYLGHLYDSASKKEDFNAWKTKRNSLSQQCGEAAIDAYWNAKKRWLCRASTKVGVTTVEMSPCKTYRLEITRHKTGKGTWNYSHGRVFDGEGELVGDVCRNYGSFPFAWVCGHPDGNDYLLCGSDYQGQTVVCLTTGERKDFLPKAAQNGMGFCYASMHPNPKGDLLAAVGCFWGGPYEVWMLDFSDPMDMPWPVLHRIDELDEAFEWVDDDTCLIGVSYEVCTLEGSFFGKKYDDFTEEEDDAFEAIAEAEGKDEDDYFVEKREIQEWKRPSPLDALKNYNNSNLQWRMKRENVLKDEDCAMISKLLAKLSPAELRMAHEDESLMKMIAYGKSAGR